MKLFQRKIYENGNDEVFVCVCEREKTSNKDWNIKYKMAWIELKSQNVQYWREGEREREREREWWRKIDKTAKGKNTEKIYNFLNKFFKMKKQKKRKKKYRNQKC